MKPWPILLGALLLLNPTISSAGVLDGLWAKCGDLLEGIKGKPARPLAPPYFEVHTGTLVESLSRPGRQVYFLGKGQARSSAETYRVIETTAGRDPFIYIEKNSKEELSMDRDLKTLGWINEAAEKDPEPKGFRFVRVLKRVNREQAQLSYTQGRDLYSLLVEVDPELSRRLLENYRHAVSDYLAFLDRNFDISLRAEMGWPKGMHYVSGLPPLETMQIRPKGQPGMPQWITIKPDNVVVDPMTLQMTLIDPH